MDGGERLTKRSVVGAGMAATAGASGARPAPRSGPAENKRLLRRFIDVVWTQGKIDALPEFWTADAVNHAAPEGHRNGLESLRAYHEGFAQALRAFSDFTIRIERQVAEGDFITTYLVSTGTQTTEFQGIPATGRKAALESMRIDRVVGGKIAEHWSVGDMAGFLTQLRG